MRRARESRKREVVEAQLSRIQSWERPELTATLCAKLTRLSAAKLNLVFETCWRRHAVRPKALDSPAAWWAKLLAVIADEAWELERQEVPRL